MFKVGSKLFGGDITTSRNDVIFESPLFYVGRSQFIEYYLNIDVGLLVSKLFQSGYADCFIVSIRVEKINILSVLGCPDYVIDCY